jgi:hypothetical protein
MARVIPPVLVLLPLLTAPQGAKPAPSTALDYLYVSRDRVPWPSPESLEKDLRSIVFVAALSPSAQRGALQIRRSAPAAPPEVSRAARASFVPIVP